MSSTDKRLVNLCPWGGAIVRTKHHKIRKKTWKSTCPCGRVIAIKGGTGERYAHKLPKELQK